MKTCTFCKQDSSDDAIECQFCGNAVVSKGQAQQNPERVATNALAPMPPMKVSTLFGMAILLIFFGLLFIAISPPLGLIMRLVGVGFYLAGCWKFTNNKGWNGWLGVFLGITAIGLIVMALLEDKTKQPKQPASPKI